MPADISALKALPPIGELGELDDLEPQVPLDAPQDAPNDANTEIQTSEQTPATEGQPENGSEAGNPEQPEGSKQAEKPAEISDELTADHPDALAWRTLQKNFEDNPKSFIATLTGSLPQEQAQAILAVLNGNQVTPQAQAQQDDITFQDDALLTPEEMFVKRNADTIKSVPAFKQEVTSFAQQAGQILQSHAAHLDQVLLQNAFLQTQVQALLEHSGLKLPDMDEAKVRTVLATGKSHKDAVAAVYAPNAKRAVATTAAKGQPVPSTPQNAATGGAPSDGAKPSGDSFVNIFREVAAQARR